MRNGSPPFPFSIPHLAACEELSRTDKLQSLCDPFSGHISIPGNKDRALLTLLNSARSCGAVDKSDGRTCKHQLSRSGIDSKRCSTVSACLSSPATTITGPCSSRSKWCQQVQDAALWWQCCHSAVLRFPLKSLCSSLLDLFG